MHILGILFALGAGLFFGIVRPVTKIAYNLGVSVGLAIFLRYGHNRQGLCNRVVT